MGLSISPLEAHMPKRQADPVPSEPVRTAAQLLTTAQVADQLQVDVKTVRDVIARHELAAYRVGREYRVHPDHLAAYIAALAILPAQGTLEAGAATA